MFSISHGARIAPTCLRTLQLGHNARKDSASFSTAKKMKVKYLETWLGGDMVPQSSNITKPTESSTCANGSGRPKTSPESARYPSSVSSIASDMEASQTRARPTEDDAASAHALVHRGHVRSGQQIYAQGRSLIVFGNVHSDAELYADGDIHVFGRLRGRAVAGLRHSCKTPVTSDSLTGRSHNPSSDSSNSSASKSMMWSTEKEDNSFTGDDSSDNNLIPINNNRAKSGEHSSALLSLSAASNASMSSSDKHFNTADAFPIIFASHFAPTNLIGIGDCFFVLDDEISLVKQQQKQGQIHDTATERINGSVYSLKSALSAVLQSDNRVAVDIRTQSLKEQELRLSGLFGRPVILQLQKKLQPSDTAARASCWDGDDCAGPVDTPDTAATINNLSTSIGTSTSGQQSVPTVASMSNNSKQQPAVTIDCNNGFEFIASDVPQ